MENYITLGLNIALAVFVGMGILVGFIRGLRKTTSRGIFLIITSIILLFVTIPITSALLKIKINADFTYGESTLVGNYSIEECISFFVKSMLGEDFSANNPEFVSVITALPIVFVNAIVYLLLFVICKYLLLPLNFLFYKLTFAPKHPKENLAFDNFGDDVDFDKIEEEVIKEESNSDPTQNNLTDTTQNNLAEQINNNLSDSNDNNPSDQTQNNSFDDNLENNVTMLENSTLNLNNSSVNDNAIENSNMNLNAMDSSCVNINVEDNADTNLEEDVVTNASESANLEDQFGKDNLFIKKEIDQNDKSKQELDFVLNNKKDKKQKHKKEKIKYKKHRLLGGLVGGLVGMFVMLNVLLPVYGFVNVAKQSNELTIENLSDENMNMSTVTNGVSDDILNGYNKSIFATISKYTGVEGLALAEFDYLTTKNIGDKKINLRQDVTSLVKTLKKADSLVGKYKTFTVDNSLSSLTQEQIEILITDAQDLMTTAKDVGLADCVADYIIPVACSLILNNGTKISDNEIINRLAINAIEDLAKSNDIDVFEETNNLLDLAHYLNKQGLLVKILSNDLSDPIGTIQGLDDDFGTQFMGKLFKLKTVNLTMPYLLNIGLNYLNQAIDYGYSEVDYTEIKNTLSTTFSNFVDNILAVIKSIDTNSSIYLTQDSLIPTGKLLQTVKTSGLVNESTYTNLISYGCGQIKDIVKDLLPSEFEDYMTNEFVENIKKVDRWDEEMTKISSAISLLRDNENGILGDVEEGEDIRHGLKLNIVMKQSVFENIGKSLDILESTVLFGARTYKDLDGTNHQVSGTVSMFLSLLDYANSQIVSSADSMQKMSEVIEDIQTNLIKSNHVYIRDTEFWKNELTDTSPLIIEIYNMIDKNKFEVTDGLGAGLDKAKNTTMLGSGTTITLMKVAMDIVEDNILGKDYVYNDGSDISNPQVLNDKLHEMFTAVKNNLNQESTKDRVRLDSKFWENELKYFQNLTNIAENSNFESISDAKVLAKDLDAISDSYIIPQKELFNIVAFAIKDIKSSSTSTLDTKINEVIDRISDRLSDYNTLSEKDLKDFWQIEFDHISNLMDIKFSDDGEYKIIDNLANIGVELDKVIFGYTVLDNPLTDADESKNVRASYLLQAGDLREILASSMEEMSLSITSSFDNDIKGYVQNALNSIKANVEDLTNIPVVSFEKELRHMQTLANLEIDGDMLKFPSGTDAEIEAKLQLNNIKLQALGKQLDSIAYAYVNSNNKFVYTDKLSNSSTNSQFISRNILTTLIKNIFDIAKLDDSSVSNDSNLWTMEDKELKAFNNLIVSIQNEISNVVDLDKVMSWQRELSFVNSLVKLNGDKTYTIDNVSTTIGANLDAIAFNTRTENDALIFDDILYSTDCIYIPNITTGSVENLYSGNSLFITRASLKALMNNYIDRIKETVNADDDEVTVEQKTLVNDIMSNSINVISSTNENLASADFYNDFEDTFVALKEIKTDIDNKLNTASTGCTNLTRDDALVIDQFLNDYQTKPLTGVLLTRRIAKLILNKLGEPTTALTGTEIDTILQDAKDYYNNLKAHYQTNITNNSLEKENYFAGSTVTDEFKNPFVTLFEKIENLKHTSV